MQRLKVMAFRLKFHAAWKSIAILDFMEKHFISPNHCDEDCGRWMEDTVQSLLELVGSNPALQDRVLRPTKTQTH
jgi:hypothetical protein